MTATEATDSMTTADESLDGMAKKVARGATFITIGGLIMRMIGLVNTLLLARILVPADFGLVAIGITAMQILENISEICVARTVVKFRDGGRALIDTLFTLSFLKGLLVLLLLVGGAPLAAHFYGDERLTLIFVVMGFTAFVRALMNPRFFEFERDIDFSRELIVNVVSKTLSVVLSVGIALLFRTYWAIVIGMAAAVVVQVAMSYLFRPYRPRFSLADVRRIFGFVGWVTAMGAVTALNNKLGIMVLGRLLGAGQVGAVYVGDQLSSLPSNELADPIARALYPGLSSLQDNTARMQKAFLAGCEALGAIALPAAFGLSFIAQDFTRLVLGEGWGDAAHVIAVLAPVFGLLALMGGVQMLVMAQGLVRQLFIRDLMFLPVQIPLLIVMTWAFGFEGAVWGLAASSLVYVGLQCRLYVISTQDHWWRPFAAAHRPLLAVAAMSAWFLLIRPFLGGLDDQAMTVRLLVDIATGAGIYVAVLFGLWTAEGRPEGLEKAVTGTLASRLGR